jgi:glycosyltransferase involved in cell wall biosynthesis
MISGSVVAAANTRASDRAPVRVLHLHSGNLYGGLETFLRTIAQHWTDAAQATMDYALCFEGRLASELRAAGATVRILGEVRVRSPRRVAAVRRELARVLRAGQYDVVVSHSVWTQALFGPVVRKHGARLVCFLHDVTDPLGWLDRWASFTPPDLVLCNSGFTEGASRWLFPKVPRRTVLLPMVVGKDAGESRRVVRASLGTDEGAIVILQASRMQSWKGQRLLIDALSTLRGDPRWTCWIAGASQRPSEVAYYRKLIATVDGLGLAARIKFLGQRDDVATLMRAADLYCQPNVRPEPFGLSFVEALTAGLPVVTTAMGGALEIVTPECGRLTPPEPRAVAIAIADYLDDDAKRRAVAEAGPARARELCDVMLRTRDLVGELVRLVAPSGTSPSAAGEEDALLSVVSAALREKGTRLETVIDLGCGRGDCARYLDGMCGQLVSCEVQAAPYPFDSESASAVIAIETIGHLENPRTLVREMARVVQRGGWVAVTTRNPLSLASKVRLVARNEFELAEDVSDRQLQSTRALVEDDLVRMARESGLVDIELRYTDRGRIPMTARYWPRRAGLRGRWFSDNVVMLARRP